MLSRNTYRLDLELKGRSANPLRLEIVILISGTFSSLNDNPALRLASPLH